MSSESDIVDLQRGGPSSSRLILNSSSISSKHIDEAVEGALADRQVPDSTGRAIKELLSRDANSDIARAYFAEYNARGTARLRTRMRKSKLNINYSLTDEQIITLADYAPEYDLCFRNCEMHDHPMAAAMRVLDHAILNSRIPVLAKVTDVGGDPLYHIRNGNLNVHCCDPISDVKDDSRRTIRNLTAKTMLREKKYDKDESRILLESYLGGGPAHFCSNKAQDCYAPSDVITAVHVYDVPLEDWPVIMENKGANVVEGAIIFSNKFFINSSGELPDSGVRYEIDTVKDKFKMGFIGSPSWWYSHKWSHLTRYGIDQRIVHNGRVFSYKIVERRKDTIFFRILAVGSKKTDHYSFFGDKATHKFVYPEIRMVEIEGFDFDSTGITSSRPTIRRKKFSVAVTLWEALVNTAIIDFERGVLDFQKMFNAYRTLAPRHTINGVLVSGGYSVEPEDLDCVVIHASVVGAMQCTLADRTNRAMTDIAFDARARMSEGTAKKILGALGDSLKYAAITVGRVARLKSLASLIEAGLSNSSYLHFISESYEPTIVRVSVDRLFKTTMPSWFVGLSGSHDMSKEQLTPMRPMPGTKDFGEISATGLLHDVIGAACADYVLAKFLLDNLEDTLTEYDRKRLQDAVMRLAPRIKLPTKDVVGPEKVPDKPTENASSLKVLHNENWQSKREKRLAAIAECIVEIKEENVITESLCRRMMSTYVLGFGSVNEVALRRDAEANGNPDLWKVRRGVLSRNSVKGVPVRDFAHAVAYSQTAIHGAHGNFVKVKKHEWTNEQTGEVEINFVMDSQDYSGYLLVCDALLIYNGPEILKALETSLTLPHDYSVKLVEGPPGCGKTYAIIHEYKEGDFVMCPVRESSDDTKMRLQELHPEEKDIPKLVRTVDSFLMHGLNGKAAAREFTRILADECFMTHAGKWYAAAALLGVNVIQAYGDTKQIPHIPRVQVPKNHVSLEYDEREFNPITRRCPADSVAAWADLYGNLVRSTNSITTSLFEVNSARAVTISKRTCLMGMYQSDKKEIRRLFPQHSGKSGNLIVTAHEAEGKTYPEVVLFRFDRRVRKDKLSLYDQEPHVLVAISRHTERFTYVRADGLNDLVSKMIVNSRNPRRIKDILDISKAGIPYG